MGGYGKGRGKGARSDGDGPGKAAGKAAIKGKSPTPAQVPALPVPEVPPGTDLVAQHADGKWYPAVVMSQRRAHPQVEVHFHGESPKWDPWLDVEQLHFKHLKGKASVAATRTAGATDVSLPPQGSTFEASGAEISKIMSGQHVKVEVKEVSTVKAKAKPVKILVELWVPPSAFKDVRNYKAPVTVKGQAEGARAAPPPPPQRSAATSTSGLTVGMQLQAEYSDGRWYKATVEDFRKGPTPVKISYLGHHGCDRWVSYDELHSKVLRKVAPSKGGGKTTQAEWA